MAIGRCHHVGCGSIGELCHRKGGSESKIAPEVLCFTIETVVGGREGGRFCGLRLRYVCAGSQ